MQFNFDRLGVAIATQMIRFRWWVFLASLVAVVFLASGARFLYFDNNYRAFFGEDNPQLQAFDQLQNVYTKTDNVVFVIQPKSGDIFQPDVFRAVQLMTEKAWQLPYSTRVDSLSNFQHTYADGDTLIVEDLVGVDPETIPLERRQALQEIALNEPLLVNRILSSNATTTGVNVTFIMPEESAFEVPEVHQAVVQLLEEMRAAFPDITFIASGVVEMNNAFMEASQKDMATLLPIMYLVLLVAMVVFLRSFWAMVATLFVIAFSAAIGMGVGGWMGIGLTPPSAGAPTIILTLAIADSVHIIVSMLKEMSRGTGRREAVIESLRINFQPVFLTSLTTIIGFLSLNFSDAPPFHDLGNITAVGIAAAFVLSVTFLPAILSLLPIKANKHSGSYRFAEDLGHFVVKFRKPLLIISSVVVIGCISMIPKLELNDEFVQYFDHSIPFRGDAEFMMEHLTGIYALEFSLGADGAEGISDPLYLHTVERFAQWLRRQPEVQHVYSVTDIFKRLNKNLHADDADYDRLPDSRELGAQYLLLYEMSLPYRLDLNDRINVDKSASRLTATIYDLSTVEIRDIKNRSEAWLKENAPDYMHTKATSPVVMFAYISERNINSMMKGNIIALILISLVILVVLRHIKIGLFSLIPNLVPALMGFGIWALFVGQVNMAVAIIAAVSLGIIVDDTVHFLSKYLRAIRENGLSSQEAVKYAFANVGAALIITTLVLVCGFAILTFSAFQINSVLGQLTALVLVCALLVDFFLLPPLLMMFDRQKGEKK